MLFGWKKHLIKSYVLQAVKVQIAGKAIQTKKDQRYTFYNIHCFCWQTAKALDQTAHSCS